MGNNKNFGFVYDRTARVIRECSIPALNDLSPETLFTKPEAAEAFADVKDFKTGWLMDALETGTPVTRQQESLSSKCVYTLSVTPTGENKLLFTLHRSGRIPFGSATRRLYLNSVLILLVIIALCSAIIVLMRRNILNNKQEEAQETMKMISEQIDSTIVVKFNAWFNELYSFSSLVDEYGSLDGNEDAVNKLLNNYRVKLPFENIGVLLESGDLYFSDNQIYSIFSESLAKTLIIDNAPAIDLISIDGEERIVFGIPMEARGARSSETLAAVCGVAPISAVNKLLNVAAFNGNSVVAVYKDDGFSVAISENAVPPKEESRLNFFIDMEVQKSKGEADALEAEYHAGNSFLTTAEYGREGFFVYHSALDVLEENGDASSGLWHLVIYVPESAIFSSINQMFNMIMLVIGGAFCLLVGAVALTALLFIKKHGNDLALRKQLVANEMLETATDRALEASQAKTVFLSNMSHDIRTPINGIIGMTTIAQKHIDERDTVKDCLNKIEGASAHLLSLVNDVLDMSRIESKKIEIARDVMNLRLVMQECCSIVAGQLADRKIEFCHKETILHPDVLGDNLHLRQILINILGNSVKFTPDGGKITFSVEEGAQRGNIVTYYFTVTDTGCGMTKEFLDHVFEPFAQENITGRTNYKGTGLGLAISLQLAKLMGGGIQVDSELDHGSTFRVELPFELSTVSVLETEEKGTAEDANLSGVRVLLVEDNDLNMELATVLLSESGLLVEGATNGKEACEKFAAHREHYYDLILMDVMMPVMDGITAAKTIRAMDHPEAASVPIVAMTANAFEADIRKTREAGMNAHLSKPIYIKEVLRVIRRVLGKK